MDNKATPVVQTQFIKLVGGNVKVPIRSAPKAQGEIKKFIVPGDVVEVKVLDDSKKFYRLADGLVRNS